jgi:hypothetical protein
MPEPTPEAWAQIRYDYEHTDRPIEDICLEHGISSGTLRDRMRRWQWKRRRVPIPREGPPPLVATQAYGIVASAPLPAGGERSAAGAERRRPGEGALPSPAYGENPPQPISSPGSEIDPRSSRGQALFPQAGRGNQAAMPVVASSEVTGANAEADAASIVPRLQGAVVRVLPAIEATIARLAAGPHHPREMEQAGRALGALTRTLRELNALLSQHNAGAGAAFDDDMPEDMDAFREELARRIEVFMESRADDDVEEQEA